MNYSTSQRIESSFPFLSFTFFSYTFHFDIFKCKLTTLIQIYDFAVSVLRLRAFAQSNVRDIEGFHRNIAPLISDRVVTNLRSFNEALLQKSCAFYSRANELLDDVSNALHLF